MYTSDVQQIVVSAVHRQMLADDLTDFHPRLSLLCISSIIFLYTSRVYAVYRNTNESKESIDWLNYSMLQFKFYVVKGWLAVGTFFSSDDKCEAKCTCFKMFIRFHNDDLTLNEPILWCASQAVLMKTKLCSRHFSGAVAFMTSKFFRDTFNQSAFTFSLPSIAEAIFHCCYQSLQFSPSPQLHKNGTINSIIESVSVYAS